MNFSKKLITTAVLLASSSIALAVTESTDIEINVEQEAVVAFTGDLAGNVSRDLSVAEANGTVTLLGNLGTESNTVGSCDLDISSLNNFRLQHNVDATLFLHATNSYTINYVNTAFTAGAANTVNLASCNNVASAMQIATPGFDASRVQSGTYSDILTVTVTTQ